MDTNMELMKKKLNKQSKKEKYFIQLYRFAYWILTSKERKKFTPNILDGTLSL